MTEDLKELAELQPQSSFVIVKGTSYEIKPFKFRHMFAVLNHISNMIDDVNPYEDETKQFFRLVGKHSEDVLGIMALAINKKIDFFDDIETEEGLDLAATIWKINQDFFVQKVQPKLEALGLNMVKTESQSQDLLINPEANTKLPEEQVNLAESPVQ